MNREAWKLEAPEQLRRPQGRIPWLAAALACSLTFLILCLAAADVLSPDGEKTAAAQREITFTQLIPGRLGTPCRVTVTAQNESYTLILSEGVCSLQGEGAAVDQHAAKELLSSGAAVIARQRLEGDPEDFGLGAQALQAEFTYEDGTHLTLRLGNPVPTGEGWYAQMEGDNAIWVVNNSLQQTLNTKKQALYALPDLSERFTAQTLLSVTVAQPGAETVAVARVTKTNPFNTKVELTEPIHYPANAERAAEVYLALEQLQITGVKDLHGQDADWGLDEPLAVLLLEDKVSTRLTIGEKDGAYTLRIDGEDAVYTLDPQSLSFLGDVSVPWLAEQLPGLVMLSQVEEITVRTQDETVVFHTDQANAAYAVNGRAMAEEEFLPLYQQMIGMLIERYVPEDAEAGELRLQMEYTLNTGEVWTLSLTDFDESYDLIVRGGCARFLISKAKTDALIETIINTQEVAP